MHPRPSTLSPVLAALCALALMAPPVPATDVIDRPARPTSEPPTGPVGYSATHIDKAVSPRQDFYRYATGKWLQRLVIPDAEADIGGFAMLGATLDERLLQITLQAVNSSAPAGSPAQQVGDYFRAAMDMQRRDSLGLAPIQADLERALAASGPIALARLSARLQRASGLSPLVNVQSMVDLKDSTHTRMVLIAGGPQLEQDQYTDPASQTIRDLYMAYITQMYRHLGDSPDRAAGKARLILAMETELMAPRLDPLAMRDPARINNIFSAEEAQALIPAVDLRALVAALKAPMPAELQILDVGAMQALNKLLTTRSPKDVQTFLHWSMLSSNAEHLGQPWFGASQAYQRQRDGLATNMARDRQVVRELALKLYHPLAQLYVKAFFPDDTRQDIARMVGDIKTEFAQRLRANPWLDPPTRDAALAKLARVDIQVGYPQQWIDFSGVEIRADDHLGNTRRIDAFHVAHDLAKLGRPAQPERFADPAFTSPTVVNAAYDPQMNGIDITAAIAQPPFYLAGGDIAVNYCTMGAVIGHELTHGFDSTGRLYDAAGNVRDWWTPRATAEFKRRTDVLVDQVNQFSLLPGLKQNGALTLGENTADLGGITLAHAALKRALGDKAQPEVDGLTTDQRCFVAWAQMWIYKAREERIRLLAATDYHAIGFVRGVAPLLNLDAFHTAFGTRPGDPMWRSPDERVTIW